MPNVALGMNKCDMFEAEEPGIDLQHNVWALGVTNYNGFFNFIYSQNAGSF